jgi:hypothetical protein
MYKKIVLACGLLASVLVSQALAVSDVYIKNKADEASNLDYRFTYNDGSLLEFATTRLYCGVVYIFSSANCYERATTTQASSQVNVTANNFEVGATVTPATPANIVVVQSTSTTPTYIPQPTYTQPQTVYQVIERVIERAVPGPKGDKGDKGDAGAPGSTMISGQAGQQVSGSGYYSSYTAGAQYNGAISPNSVFSTVNTGSLIAGSVQSNSVNAGAIVTGNLTATGTTNLATTTISTLNVTSLGAATLTASNTLTDNLIFGNATGTNLVTINASSTNFFAGLLNALTAYIQNLTADNATVTNSFTVTGTSTLSTTTVTGSLSLGSVASGSATSSLLVYGPNGEVQQLTPAAMLASNTTNVINYTGDPANSLVSTVNGVISTTTIGTLNNLNLTGTTTSQNIVNSGNFLTNFLSAVTGYISNLIFDNAAGTNITATGTANLANIVSENVTITNLIASTTTTNQLNAASGTVGSVSSNASGTTITGTTSISGPLFATNTTLGGNTTINGGTTTINGVVINDAENIFSSTSTFNGPVVVNGEFITNATVTNNGPIVNNGVVVNNSTTTNNGTSIFNGIAQFFNDVFNYGNIFNYGTTTNNGVVINNNEVINNATTTNNGQVVNNGPVTNYGTTTLEGPVVVNGTTTFNGVVDLSNASVTFPNSPIANATITNLVFENATGTNLTLENASITNATVSNLFADILNAFSAFFTNLTATNATVTNLVSTNSNTGSTTATSLTVTGSSTLASTTINGPLSLNPVASGSATSSLLVYGPNGEVQQITAGEMLASNTTNLINYTGDASNTLESTVNGVLSTTSIDTLNNVNLTGTTTSENIVNSGNFITNFLSAVTGYISNLIFDNATGTNITATGTASLANLVATNTLSTNIEGTNATLTNATSTNLFSTNASITNATVSNLVVDSISVPNTLSSSGNVMTSNVGGSISTTTTINSNTVGYSAGTLTSTVNGVVATTSLAGLVTADNGLTINPANNVQLGGTLVQDTTVDGQGFDMSFIKNRLLQLLGNFVEIGQDGDNTFNGSGYQVAVGNGNTLNNDYNTAIGDKNTVGGNQAVVIGYENTLDANDNSYILGTNNKSIVGSKDNYFVGESNDFSGASESHVNVFGSYNIGTNNVSYSNIFGKSNTIDKTEYSTVVGRLNTVSGVNNSYLFGENLSASGDSVVEFGTVDATKITLDATGRMYLRGALNVSTSDGNSGDILTSQGSTAMPVWSSPASILAGATTNILGFATSTNILSSTVNGVLATTSINLNIPANGFSIGAPATTTNSPSFFYDPVNLAIYYRDTNGNVQTFWAPKPRNGLTSTVGNFQELGGSLIHNTSVNQGSFAMSFVGAGNFGIGTSTPNNKLEITHGTSGNSGLRFTNLTSSNSSATTSNKVLTVNSLGDVVLATVPGTENIVEFSVNANPNTAGTTFSPNQQNDPDVIYTSTIDNSTWKWNGSTYVTYIPTPTLCNIGSQFFCNNGNTTGANRILGTNDNFNLGFETNNVEKMTLFNLANPSIGIGRTSLTGVNGGASSYSGPTLFTGAAGNFSGNTGWDFIMDDDNNATNNQIRFRTNGDGASGTIDIMTVDEVSGGRVGIGTTAPGYKLDIYDASTAFAQTRVSGGGSGGGILTRLQNDGGKEYIIGVGGSNNNSLGTDAFFIRDGNSFANRFVIASSTGNVGIGNFASSMPTAQLHTTGSIRFQAFGAGTLTTDASGNVTVSSDERLKDIEGDFTRGLEDLKKIKPITYKWNDISGLEKENSYSGFSAQNVQEAIPEAISTDPRGFLSLQERPILAAVVNALKEIADKLDKLADVVNTKLIQTDRLCIGSTCVDEAQLQQMLNSQNIAPAPAQVIIQAPVVTEATVTGPTTTPESVTEVATTTEPVPAVDTNVTEPAIPEVAPVEPTPMTEPAATETAPAE